LEALKSTTESFIALIILKTLFLYFLVYEKLCECQSFYVMKIQKKWWHLCSLEYGIGWHWSSKEISNVAQRSNTLLIIVQLRSKLLQPFLVEKELHYDNCVLLYFWCELPLRNASEGSLIILKMTAVKNCWKQQEYIGLSVQSERRCFSEERSFQICHYVCFLNPIFIFSEMESEAWKLMKFWEQIWMELEWSKLFDFFNHFWVGLKRVRSGKLWFCSFVHLWRLLMKYRIE
jgi:hypothetical protein